jgi:hypothetical protein
MIEIKYKDNFEVTDATGCTVTDIRDSYKAEFSIEDKATAFLNGRKVNASSENSTIINDEDKLVFKKSSSHRLPYLVGALILAMAITGGIFAYGFVNASATITVTAANSDFATVTANTSSLPSWTVQGMQKSSTGTGSLFDINTQTSGYTGDLVATITIANTGDLTEVYRSLNLVIEVRDSSNNLVDINNDGIANSNDCTLLTLNNATVSLPITQSGTNVYTVTVKSGYYISNAKKSSWTPSSGTPMLYCEIAQR